MKNFPSSKIFLLRISERKIGGACHIGLAYTQSDEEKFSFSSTLVVCHLFLFSAEKGKQMWKKAHRERNEKISKGTVVITVEERKRNCWLFWLCRQMINNKSCFVLKSFSLLENQKAISNDFSLSPTRLMIAE